MLHDDNDTGNFRGNTLSLFNNFIVDYRELECFFGTRCLWVVGCVKSRVRREVSGSFFSFLACFSAGMKETPTLGCAADFWSMC